MQASATTLPRNQWHTHRNAIITDDFPTTTNSYDPITNVGTQRLVNYMVDAAEAEITPINLRHLIGTALEIRTKFSTSGASANLDIWGVRENDTAVKRLARITGVTAGTQRDAGGLYFAATGTPTSYSVYAFDEPENDEAGTGIYDPSIITKGYDRMWITLDTISAGSVTIEVSTY